MGIFDPTGYGAGEVELTTEETTRLMQDWFFDEVAHMPEQARKQLLESPEFAEQRNALMEAGLINKTSIMMLSKESELERRNQLAVYALAKKDNDVNWQRFMKAQAMKKEAKEALNRKYGSRARLTAKKTQRDYLKRSGGVKNYHVPK